LEEICFSTAIRRERDSTLDRRATNMSHRNRSRNIDYARAAKLGFLFGVALFVVGMVGEIAGHALLPSLPESVYGLLFSMEILGVLVGFFTPITFGAILPLTE
jgi:hypothetical protein